MHIIVQWYLTLLYIIHGVDQNRYEKYIKDLEKKHIRGRNGYPTTIHRTYTFLSNWKVKGDNPEFTVAVKARITFTID